MYLEISGRRTGKTTRMLEAAIKAYIKGKRVAIFIMGNKRNIQKQIEKLSKDILIDIYPFVDTHKIKIFTSREDFKNSLLGTSLFTDDFHVFYDEFDYISKREEVILSLRGYYVTTPVKIRTLDNTKENDTLFKLLYMNSGTYVKHTSETLAKEFTEYYNDMYAGEIKGEFIDENKVRQ
jgi:hypothetical protein